MVRYRSSNHQGTKPDCCVPSLNFGSAHTLPERRLVCSLPVDSWFRWNSCSAESSVLEVGALQAKFPSTKIIHRITLLKSGRILRYLQKWVSGSVCDYDTFSDKDRDNLSLRAFRYLEDSHQCWTPYWTRLLVDFIVDLLLLFYFLISGWQKNQIKILSPAILLN